LIMAAEGTKRGNWFNGMDDAGCRIVNARGGGGVRGEGRTREARLRTQDRGLRRQDEGGFGSFFEVGLGEIGGREFWLTVG
jgi:hypothetical protein